MILSTTVDLHYDGEDAETAPVVFTSTANMLQTLSEPIYEQVCQSPLGIHTLRTCGKQDDGNMTMDLDYGEGTEATSVVFASSIDRTQMDPWIGFKRVSLVYR